jgi:hypothetical protein
MENPPIIRGPSNIMGCNSFPIATTDIAVIEIESLSNDPVIFCVVQGLLFLSAA